MKGLVATAVCASALMAGCFLNNPELPATYNFAPDDADSLFTLLVDRVQTVSEAENYSEVVAQQFTDLRDGFNQIIQQDNANQKANVGYIVASVLSLNTSSKVRAMTDSLDAYFCALDSSDNAMPLSKAFRKQGLIGLSKCLGAKTPEIALAQTKRPSFPAFLTMSYVQQTLESEVLPVLDNIITAAGRLEARGETSIPVTIDDDGDPDTFEIDKGEIYILDGFLHYLRAYSNWLCAYNIDVYAPGATNNSWIDSLLNGGAFCGGSVYTLSNDTLYQCSKFGADSLQLYMLRTLKYNLERPGFLTLRAANHAKVKANLLAVPELLKTGISSIRAESDDQGDDIIKLDDILDLDEEMADVPADLIEAGISESLANKFRTPETLMDFVKQLLSGPYSFDETVDSVHIQLTIDIGAFFDHPVQDLRTLLPKYRWQAQDAWRGSGMEDYRTVYGPSASNVVDIYDEQTTVEIPQARIDSVRTSPYGGTTYYLNQPYNFQAHIDSSWTLDPLRLTDDSGNELNIDSLADVNSFFPYFADYTFDGVFPGMTRQKWLDLFYQNGGSIL